MAITLTSWSQDLFVVNYDGQYGKYYEFRAQAREDNISTANNNGLVTVDVLMRRPDGSSGGAWNQNGTGWSITIDGETFTGNSKWDTRGTSDWQYIGYAQKWITHNSDGNKSITISAYHTGNSASGSSKMGNASGSATVNLQTIPRYTTVYNSVRSRGLNSISINWSTTDARNWTQYSLNGGGWQDAYDTVASDQKSGYYTISGLSPNTQYTVKTRCMRTDSGLWSEASSLSVTTYDIARISNLNHFNLGDSTALTISNPSGASAVLYLSVDNTQILSKNVSNGNNTVSFTDEQLDNIYKKFKTSNTVVASYKLITNNNSNWASTATATCFLTGNQKTAHIKTNDKWKRGKLWIKVSGTWKRAVTWKNINGTWKRGG